MPKELVVKVQKPIMTNEVEPLWLIYDEEREHTFQIKQSEVPQNIKDIIGHRNKAYFRATYEDVGHCTTRVVLLPEEVVGELW